ncbi:MAG: FAD-dependent thymidylate synthase [Clostridiales bacterium]|nr:FAD-dependent thymidylate synthase [Clostridiales bacterium]
MRVQPNVILIAHTPEAEKVVAMAAKICYAKDVSIKKLQKKINDNDVSAFITKLLESGHESPFEHISFTFGIEGISRACSHQLVRHRMASFSQRSQRYCFEDGFNYIEPEDINENENEDKIFRDFMRHSKEVYSKLIDKGVKPEDARMVLPNACETKIIVTMNARELLHFFKLRCCKRAQKEIREVAFMMKNICRKVAPNIFQYAGPNCLKGYCTEGEKSCMKDNDNIKKIIP